MKVKREEMLGVRLTHKEKVLLKQLAEREDRTMSQQVRRALRVYLAEDEEEGEG